MKLSGLFVYCQVRAPFFTAETISQSSSIANILVKKYSEILSNNNGL